MEWTTTQVVSALSIAVSVVVCWAAAMTRYVEDRPADTASSAEADGPKLSLLITHQR